MTNIYAKYEYVLSATCAKVSTLNLFSCLLCCFMPITMVAHNTIVEHANRNSLYNNKLAILVK